jgi:hypothetical protein
MIGLATKSVLSLDNLTKIAKKGGKWTFGG